LRNTIKVDQRPEGYYFNDTKYDEYKINVYVRLEDDLKDVGEVEVGSEPYKESEQHDPDSE